MKYTLITARGKVFCFYIKEMADMYATLYGGTVITEEVLDAETEVLS
jgi:hypothetical protein